MLDRGFFLCKGKLFELDMGPFIGVNDLLYLRESVGLLQDRDDRHGDDFIEHVFAIVGEVEGCGELEEPGIEDE